MNSLADLKRLLTPGLSFQCTNYLHPHLSGERIVSEVQTNGFWYLRPGHEGRGWCEYPKVKLLSFDDEMVTFWRDTSKAVEPVFMFDFTQEEEL